MQSIQHAFGTRHLSCPPLQDGRLKGSCSLSRPMTELPAGPILRPQRPGHYQLIPTTSESHIQSASYCPDHKPVLTSMLADIHDERHTSQTDAHFRTCRGPQWMNQKVMLHPQIVGRDKTSCKVAQHPFDSLGHEVDAFLSITQRKKHQQRGYPLPPPMQTVLHPSEPLIRSATQKEHPCSAASADRDI